MIEDIGGWLHWIGGSFYTIENFIEEAREMGVSRRATPSVMQGISWGDIVFLATREPRVKAPVLIGWFFVEQAAAVETEEIPNEELRQITEIVMQPRQHPAFNRQRGCGWVRQGHYILTRDLVHELSSYTEDVFLKGGLRVFPEPYPLLKNIPVFRGWRKANAGRLFTDLRDARRTTSGRPVLTGMYY